MSRVVTLVGGSVTVRSQTLSYSRDSTDIAVFEARVGPGSGLILAEILLDGKPTSANVSSLSA